MDRRHLLALIGTSVGSLAGCSGRPRSGTSPTPSEAPTPTPVRTRRVSMGQTVTVDDARMTVANPRVRKAVVSRGAHTYVVARAGQFVVVDVTVSGTVPSQADDIDLRSSVDGDPLPESDPLSTVGGEDRYALPFPAERPETAAIRWATGEARIYLENDGGGTLIVQFPDEDGLTRVERNVEVPTATESNDSRR